MRKQSSANQFNLFPPMTTLAEARNTAQQASGAALFVAGMTTFVILLSSLVDQSILGLDINFWGFIGVLLYGAIAFGIYRMSRIAAIAGIILYIADRIYIWSVTDQGMGQTGIVIFLIFAFINGVRGTFAYHHLKKIKQNPTDDILCPPN